MEQDCLNCWECGQQPVGSVTGPETIEYMIQEWLALNYVCYMALTVTISPISLAIIPNFPVLPLSLPSESIIIPCDRSISLRTRFSALKGLYNNSTAE